MAGSAGGELDRHPAGLYVLFFTEMWERYSFYSMMAILTLYMDEALRFNAERIGTVYGGYIAGVYFMPLAGGFLADRFLGFNRAVVFGGVLMCAGHFVLAIESLPFFYAALVLLACGSGLLKPNVSTIVGNLYHDRPQLRDAGFNIFYMGINIGAILSPICVAYFRNHFGWGVAFGSAGVAMLFSLGTFIGYNRYIAHAARRVDERSEEARLDPASARARTLALLVTYAIVVAFWLAFYQNGFTLTFWARDNTATRINPEVFQSVEPGFIVLFTPIIVAIWASLRRQDVEPSTTMKMLMGMLFTAAAFALMAMAGKGGGDTGRVSALWLVAAYGLIAIGEICLSPMGLSLVSRVAPPRARGVLMGGWFLTLSLGAYFAGKVGGRYWTAMPHSRFFLMVAIVTLIAAGVLLLALRWLRDTMASATEMTPTAA